MFLSSDINYHILPTKEYHQIWRNNISTPLNPEVVMRMRVDNRISDTNIHLAEFLYNVRFATQEQIDKYLTLTEGKTLSPFQMEKMSSYRVVNEFLVSEDKKAKFTRNPDLFRVYALDSGGRTLVVNLTNQDNWWDWRLTDNITTIESVYRELVYTDLYLNLLNSNLNDFKRNFMIRYGERYFTPGARANVMSPKGKENVLYFEVFYNADSEEKIRGLMERYESLSATNIWKKYSSRKPIIVFIAEDDELCNKLLSKLSAAFEINNLRFTTFERMKKPLYSPGAMLKVGKEGNTDTLIPVSSPYLEKGTEGKAEEKSE